MTLLLEIMVPSISGELCWGIMSSILFMPVMHSAQVFPHFFTIDKELGLAFLSLDGQIQALMEKKNFSLKGSLCFVMISDLKDQRQCISL